MNQSDKWSYQECHLDYSYSDFTEHSLTEETCLLEANFTSTFILGTSDQLLPVVVETIRLLIVVVSTPYPRIQYFNFNFIFNFKNSISLVRTQVCYSNFLIVIALFKVTLQASWCDYATQLALILRPFPFDPISFWVWSSLNYLLWMQKQEMLKMLIMHQKGSVLIFIIAIYLDFIAFVEGDVIVFSNYLTFIL